MTDKLHYQQAMRQICVLIGWVDQADGRQPEIRLEGGMLIVRSGPGQEIVLKTRDSDIRSSWDPMDGDKQLRARDQLMTSLKGMWLRPGSLCMIAPSMWQTG